MFTSRCDCDMRSGTVIPDTSVEDLTITVNWLTIDGAVASTTCGMTMRENVWAGDMPAENAASRWPRGTPSIPVRKVSARYPLDCRPSAIQPAEKKLLGKPKSSGQT